MVLSNRLKAIYDMVGKVDVLADIGTDHAYLPICLKKDNHVSRIILSDVNRGPLDTARNNVSEAGIVEDVSFRLGSGLEPYEEGEVDVYVIAGMGGNLIADILRADEEVARSASFLVLQPMKNQRVLRKYLNENSFEIIEELVVREDGRFYEVIKVSKGEQNKLTVSELELGYKMRKTACYKEFLTYKKEKYLDIIARMSLASESLDVTIYEEYIDEIEKIIKDL